MSQWNGPGGQGGPPPSGHAPTCASCGAPDNGELVTCRFCQQPVSAEAARTAIPCPNPQCRALCRWGKQRCAQCQSWIVVSCVFCGAISPHNVPSCLQCHEAFAGAPQRKAQMEAQRQHQQNMQDASVWGNVAASFLGAAAGAAVGSHSHSHSWTSYDNGSSYDDAPASSVDTFDIGGVSDDTDFDGGSSDDF